MVQDIGVDPDFSNDGRSWSFCFALYIGDGWIFYENCENVADSLEFSLILVTISVTKLTIYKFFTIFLLILATISVIKSWLVSRQHHHL